MKGKFRLWRVGLALVLAVSLSLVMAVPVSAAVVTVNCVPTNSAIGATTDHTITFDTTVTTGGVAADGTIVITYPAGFDVSGATLTSVIHGAGTWTGTLGLDVQEITLTGDGLGDAILDDADVEVILGNIVNHADKGTYTVTVVADTDDGEDTAVNIAEVASVEIMAPTEAAPAEISAGGTTNVSYQVTFDPVLDADEHCTILVSIETYITNIIVDPSAPFVVDAVGHTTNDPAPAKPVTIATTGTDGWFDLVVGVKVDTQASYEPSTETDAVYADFTAPTLDSIAWSDEQAAGNVGYSFISEGDTLTFTFSEGMDNTTITQGNINTALPPDGRSYGTAPAPALDWNPANTILTVTLGADPTILSGDQVDPANTVKDAAGNLDNTTAPPTITDDVSPILDDIVFVDRTASLESIDGGDRLEFQFSEPMDTSKITTANIATVLPTSDSHSYGTVENGLSLGWEDLGGIPAPQSLTVVLGTDHTLVDGETVNPDAAVTDLGGMPDATVTAQVITVYPVNPVLQSIVWTDTDNDGVLDDTDTLLFTFSKAMKTGVVNAGNADTFLLTDPAHGYNASAFADFGEGDLANTQCQVTLGGGEDVELTDTVNPSVAVVDLLDQLPDATPAGVPINLGYPVLLNVIWDDTDHDTTPDPGETLEFVFSKAMNTATIDNAGGANDVDTVLAPSGGSYGTDGAASLVWDGDTKVTVTLGEGCTVADTATVNPTGAVTDANANPDVTEGTGPVLDAYPWLIDIAWGDEGSKGINAGDTLTFTFSEDMEPGVITVDNVDQMLLLSGGHTYDVTGDGGSFADFTGADDDCIVTLGAGTDVADGDTVDPSDAVTDAVADPVGGNADHTETQALPAIEDGLAPLLDSIVWVNKNESVTGVGTQAVDAGDVVVFTFSEPMDTATIIDSNVNSVLVSDGAHPFDYGTPGADMFTNWSLGDTVLTVTLGSNCGIVPGTDTVTADASIKDKAGNAYAPAGVSVDDAPWLISIVWDDVDDSGTLNLNDTLTFTFNEDMDDATLDTVLLVEVGLPVTGKTDQYGTDFEVGDINLVGEVLTLTMGADPTILQGDTVNPTDAVLDSDDGNSDATQVPKAVKNDANPAILEVAGTAVHAANDTIAITFDENVTGADLAASWMVETGPVDNLTTLAITDAMLEYAPATITAAAILTITLLEPDLYLVNGQMVRVTPVADAIVDADGIAVAVTPAEDDPINAESDAPTFTIVATTVEEGMDTIVLTFTEYVKPASGNWNLVTVGLDESEFASIKAGPIGELADLDLTDATISPSDDSATITVTISLAEGVADLRNGQTAEVILITGAVDDLAGNAVTDLTEDVEIGDDVAMPTFIIAYYTDEALTTEVAVDYLKAGTYYLKITASEKLQAAPTISIAAEGSANDVTDTATTAVDGSQTVFRYTRTIYHDPAAVGEEVEQITLTGTDLAGNAVADADVTGEKWTDTTAPSSVTLHSPNGGEELGEGDLCTITWSATDTYMPDAELKIKLEYYDGTSWNTIIAETDNDSTYLWTVPAVDSSSCLVMVTGADKAGNTRSDLSNSYFTISPAAVEPEEVTTIELSVGWNLTSLMLYIPAENRGPATLLAGVTGVQIVWGNYDPATGFQSYDPSEELNDLTAMRDGLGYWVYMTAADTLDISTLGTELPEAPNAPPTYEVVVGWNLIGFKSTTAKLASSYLLAIDGKYTIIYGFADGAYFVVQAGDNLEPGYGYWIAVTALGTIYP